MRQQTPQHHNETIVYLDGKFCEPVCNVICCNNEFCNDCCCYDDEDKPPTRRDKRERNQRFSNRARTLIHFAYLYSFVMTLFTPNFVSLGMQYKSLFCYPAVMYMFLMITSLAYYEYLRICDPGYVLSVTTVPPLRSKHCSDCERVVATYDHHCIWTGNCIGEKNRKEFLFYLLLVSSYVGYCFSIACSSIYHSSFSILDDNDLKFSFFQIFLLILIWVSAIVAFCLMFFPLFLLGYQIYLISINFTSYEVLRPTKCKYLDYSSLTETYGNSFSQGIIWNWVLFLWSPAELNWRNYVSSVVHPRRRKKTYCDEMEDSFAFCCYTLCPSVD